MKRFLGRLFFILILGNTFLSCVNNDLAYTKAKVVERRDVGNGKIRISYIFKAGQTTIAGVKVIDNKILRSDSIVVKYQKNNPQQNELDF